MDLLKFIHCSYVGTVIPVNKTVKCKIVLNTKSYAASFLAVSFLRKLFKISGIQINYKTYDWL